MSDYKVGDIVLTEDAAGNRELKLVTVATWSTWEIPLDQIRFQKTSPILIHRDYSKDCVNWEKTAIEWAQNAEFYRDLLDETAKYLGPEVFVADDGSISEDPLRLKIPELVRRLTERKMSNKSKKKLASVERRLSEVEALIEYIGDQVRSLNK